MAGQFGNDGFGQTPFGSQSDPFRVTSAAALTNTRVEVSFSALLDPTDPTLVNPSTYVIPGLTVTAVVRSASSVLLTTSAQLGQSYTVTVQGGKDSLGRSLVPYGRSASFTGLLNPADVRVVPTGPDRVRVIASEALLRSTDLLSPSSYALTTVAGQALVVAEVLAEQDGNPVSVVLRLSTALQPTVVYVATLSSSLVTADGRALQPRAQDFQWVPGPLTASAELSRFAGELVGGLLGQHAGLVFFSPALSQPMAASVIQVESVTACTKAYDEYHLPAPLDPPALFTYDGGLVTPLGEAVLWGGHGTLSEARLELRQRVTDTVAHAVDGRCVVTLTEPFDHAYLSYLNNPYWTLNGDGGQLFLCVDNSAPIPPGPTTVVTLVS